MDYKTHGVCSSMIHVELDGDKIKDVDFVEKKEEFNKFIITIRLVGKAIIMVGKTN